MFKLVFLGAILSVIYAAFIPKRPPNEMQVNFWSGVRAKTGNFLNVFDVTEEPIADWFLPREDTEGYYTLIAFDSECETCKKDTTYLLWLVTNISVSNPAGNTIVGYEGPKEDNHLIFFMVYRQRDFKEPDFEPMRENFNLPKYTKENRLTIWAGNYFISQGQI